MTRDKDYRVYRSDEHPSMEVIASDRVAVIARFFKTGQWWKMGSRNWKLPPDFKTVRTMSVGEVVSRCLVAKDFSQSPVGTTPITWELFVHASDASSRMSGVK